MRSFVLRASLFRPQAQYNSYEGNDCWKTAGSGYQASCICYKNTFSPTATPQPSDTPSPAPTTAKSRDYTLELSGTSCERNPIATAEECEAAAESLGLGFLGADEEFGDVAPGCVGDGEKVLFNIGSGSSCGAIGFSVEGVSTSTYSCICYASSFAPTKSLSPTPQRPSPLPSPVPTLAPTLTTVVTNQAELVAAVESAGARLMISFANDISLTEPHAWEYPDDPVANDDLKFYHDSDTGVVLGLEGFEYGTAKDIVINGNDFQINGNGKMRCILVLSGVRVEIHNLTITNGTSADAGGGIYLEQASRAELFGCPVTYNTASRNGGGLGMRLDDHGDDAELYQQESFVILRDSPVSFNKAAHYGGGIDVVGSGMHLRLERSPVFSNTAIEGGGGIHNNIGVVELRSSPLELNTVTGAVSGDQGGGAIDNYGEFHLIDSRVYRNKASDRGGGVYNDGAGTMTLLRSPVLSNTCGGRAGGGIANEGTLTMRDSEVMYNELTGADLTGGEEPSNSGGGLDSTGTSFLYGVVFTRNTPDDYFGVLSCYSSCGPG